MQTFVALVKGITFSLVVLAGQVAVAETVGSKTAEPESVAASDLLALYQQAQSRDPRVLIAESAARRAGYQNREALGQLLPQVSADVRLTRTHYTNTRQETYYNGERYSVSISQVLFDASVWQSYQRSRSLREQYQAKSLSDIQGVAADLAQRYFDVLAAQDSLTLIQAEKRVVVRSLERIKSLLARQLASLPEKLEVEARLDRLVSDEIEAENRIRVAREALSEVVGRAVYERLERLTETPDISGFELRDYAYWREQALTGSPLIQARAAAVEAKRREKKGELGNHLPKVTLQLSSQRSNIGYENSLSGETESNVASLNVQIPIFSGGSTQARVNAAYESLVIARQELEQTKRGVLREIKTAYLNTESSLARMRASERALQSAIKAREAAEKSFSYGMNNVVDVLDRTREQYSAHRDLLEARYSFFLSYVVLKRWTGDLQESDLAQINELLVINEPQYTAVGVTGQ
ncbi:TolC family outer membrane protein [Marinobacterium sp. AK62]|uniref:TolC family outer membrane protein n=1 Tax=Marinobacterium alkalitolerans TaxID=1542925 RepID=A0ABS3ZF87_9GAMM|nr:TolC family outer membrane protein [Marinobacterium alkalitolerans]MBP0049709.1 TolC family outer membrane protein [Marinobacterium alkalitolerans]